MKVLKSNPFQCDMTLIQSLAIIFIAIFPVATLCFENDQGSVADDKKFDPAKDFYMYDVYDLRGNLVPLKRYKGKVSLVVNVASECGYTDQHYKGLVRLYNELVHTDRFTVLAFPCNQFGSQEPGSSTDIDQFVKRKYKVNFPMFAKIDVTGDSVPEAWKLLIAEAGKSPTWNFWKYLVDGKGHVVNAWGPWVDVDDIKEAILDAVEEVTPLDLPYQAHHDDQEHEHEEL
ncbi:glutathione peroxidase 7-like [Haliotis rufescens]|uniref:glutathione peroxidase 7-like n=1 Tax=Haliotis rufescens TaxID=6454 RepID=UPI00201E8B6D|nr:glutathione peroxidase 7-like [Haliotis rufescens]